MPKGQEIRHLCHNPLCVRPDHITIGTHTDNVRDSSAAGHLAVIRPNRQKLSAEDIEDIRRRVNSGELRYVVAEAFDVSKTYVTLIMQGERRQYDAPLAIVVKAS